MNTPILLINLQRYFSSKTKKNWIVLGLFGLLCPIIFLVFYTIAAYVLFNPADLLFVSEAGEKIVEQNGVIRVRYLGHPANLVPVRYDQIPTRCIEAIVASEDRTFFDNPGYDFAGLIRGIYDEFANENFGGSSITHQVIKIGTSRYFERSFWDKYHEVVFGLKLNTLLSKEEVLELYLNNIAMGNFNYGIGAAALNYFGKDVQELSLAECSYLMGIPQQPSVYHPFERPDLGIRRQYIVLNSMLLQRYITQVEFRDAINEELQFREPQILLQDGQLAADEIEIDVYLHTSPRSLNLQPVQVVTDRIDTTTFTLEQYFNPTISVEGYYPAPVIFRGASSCEGKDFEIVSFESGVITVQLCREQIFANPNNQAALQRGILQNMVQFSGITGVIILDYQGNVL